MVPIGITMLMLTLGNHGAKETPILVVFGRPGAGKSTIANRAMEMLEADPSDTSMVPIGLDLDVCVPQWMRDNFAVGKYPTLLERQHFAMEACDYVEQSIAQFERKQAATGNGAVAAIISFSFVNSDLRDTFRNRFPWAKWILVDTNDGEAQQRINARLGHFYKGKIQGQTTKQQLNQDNEDWAFAPVTFPHILLNGLNPVDKNAEVIVQMLRKPRA